MKAEDVLNAVKEFVALLEEQNVVQDREEALRVALDRLALASHFAAASLDATEYPEPPGVDYEALRERIKPLFPGLGYYNEALDVSERLGESKLGTGDAIDDLTDIAKDVQEVFLRWQVTSERDALWYFRFGFESHWGRHLRSLQLYLHDRAF